MKPTGIVRDPSYLKHDMGLYHPESPRRLEAIYAMVDELTASLDVKEVPAREAVLEEIVPIHHPRHIENIAATAGRKHTFLDPDTSACADSWEAASRAIGGLLNLIDAVVEGAVRNGFALVRPPGHHAEQSRAMGFCFFNNIALGARYAITRHKMERVAIVDWDIHHGNGTQNSFYDEPSVLFISTHQYPHYPGSGATREVGTGPGEGYTVNIPMPGGCGDAEYLVAFHTVIAPILEAYRPQMIFVSAGFDAHASDPLGGMRLSEEGYEQMLQILMHLAAEMCSDRLVLTLEGGYDIRALTESVKRILTCLGTYDPDKATVPLFPSTDHMDPAFTGRLHDVVATQSKYWPTLHQF